MFVQIRSNLNQLLQLNDEVKIIYLYRYLTLTLTSLFYLLWSNNSSLTLKLFVIGCLGISSVILNKLYAIFKNSKYMLEIIIFIETLGNMAVMIPTGGLNSPYMWYALNTVLVTLRYLHVRYCIFILAVYIISSTFISQLTVKADITYGLTNIRNSNFILGLVLVTFFAAILLRTQTSLRVERSRLLKLNNELVSLNTHLNRSMEHIMTLYGIVNATANESNKQNLVRQLLSYTREIFRSDLSFFCEYTGNAKWKINSDGYCENGFKENILRELSKQWTLISESAVCINLQTEMKKEAFIICIKTDYSIYGVLGLIPNAQIKTAPYEDYLEQLRFLASIGGLAFEKIELEKINRGLLINDEQNRIAEEIHDSVCQRLFAASCSIQSVLNKANGVLPMDVRSELILIKDSVSMANRELREAIYGMSWKKEGINVFFDDISNFVDEISRLYGVEAILKLKGNQDLISLDLKKALYRIICESVGNALRHSGCSKINVLLKIESNCTELVISDNGSGFDIVNKLDLKGGGLGIKNINNLVNLYKGKVKISSENEKGTSIIISLPNDKAEKKIV